MKKSIFIAVVLLLTIGFFGTSCCRCTGVDFEETRWWVPPRPIQILSTDWRLSDCKTFWYAEESVPRLTNFVFSDGAVLGFLYIGNNLRMPLPDTWTQVIPLDDGTEFIYSATYSFFIEPGWVTFTYQTSDAYIGTRPPARSFHIVLIW